MDDRTITEWVRHLTGSTHCSDTLTPDEVNHVVDAVGALSRRLTTDRSIVLERYLDDADLLAGYAAFYLPRSIHQVASVLTELEDPPAIAVDAGCGPGSAAQAALAVGATQVLALDHSAAALDFVDALTPECVETQQVDLETHDITRSIEQKGADTVIASHVLNELWTRSDSTKSRARWCLDVLSALPEHGRLVLIDPALRTTSRDLLAVRDAVVAGGGAVVAPCLRQSNCPALNDERDWCHTERPWEPPPLVETIAQRVGVRHDVAKMTYFVLAKQAPAHPPDRFRIVSEPLHTKGRLRYFGCGQAGREPLILKERDAHGDAAVFKEFHRGDVIEIGETVEKGDGLVIRTGERVERVAHVGDPPPSGEN